MLRSERFTQAALGGFMVNSSPARPGLAKPVWLQFSTGFQTREELVECGWERPRPVGTGHWSLAPAPGRRDCGRRQPPGSATPAPRAGRTGGGQGRIPGRDSEGRGAGRGGRGEVALPPLSPSWQVGAGTRWPRTQGVGPSLDGGRGRAAFPRVIGGRGRTKLINKGTGRGCQPSWTPDPCEGQVSACPARRSEGIPERPWPRCWELIRGPRGSSARPWKPNCRMGCRRRPPPARRGTRAQRAVSGGP